MELAIEPPAPPAPAVVGPPARREAVPVGSLVKVEGELTSFSLKRQLAIEESAYAHGPKLSFDVDLGAEGSTYMPQMHTLRSPTTATYLAMLANREYALHVEQLTMATRREQKEIEDLTDDAEALLADATATTQSYIAQLRPTLENGALNMQFVQPRALTAGYVGSSDLGASAILAGKDEVGTERDEVRAAEERLLASQQLPVREIPVDFSGGSAPAVSTAGQRSSPAKQKTLKELLVEQKEQLAEIERNAEGYQRMVSQYASWQTKRMELTMAAATIMPPLNEDDGPAAEADPTM